MKKDEKQTRLCNALNFTFYREPKNNMILRSVRFLFLSVLIFPGPCSSFTTFGEYEYFVDNRVVSSYSAAEQQCAQANATLAIVNSQDITNFLEQQIGNLSGIAVVLIH